VGAPLQDLFCVAGDAEVFDVEYFRQYQPFTGTYHNHNATLKWFRHTQESTENPFASPQKVFDAREAEDVPVCVHGIRAKFGFDASRTVKWDWKEMVAQLRDHDIVDVVRDGLVGCVLAVRPNSYDVARHYSDRKDHGLRQQEVQKPVWDFVLMRRNGTGLRLHPSWTKRQVPVWDVEPHREEIVPGKGLGRPDRPKCFQWHLKKDCEWRVHFDHKKEYLGSPYARLKRARELPKARPSQWRGLPPPWKRGRSQHYIGEAFDVGKYQV